MAHIHQNITMTHETGSMLLTAILLVGANLFTGFLGPLATVLSLVFVTNNLRKQVIAAGGIIKWFKEWKIWK